MPRNVLHFPITLSQGQIKIDMADSNKHKLAMEAVVKCVRCMILQAMGRL
jgi:hypothetical protein